MQLSIAPLYLEVLGVAVLVLLEGRMQQNAGTDEYPHYDYCCSPCFAGRSYATVFHKSEKFIDFYVAVLVLLEGRMQQQKICSDSINIFPYGSNDHPYLKRVSHFS